MRKILAAFYAVFLLCLIIAGVFKYLETTNLKTFRLSEEEVLFALADKVHTCEKPETCGLLPGDILLRRYITSRTWIFDKLANPFFTHSAFYIGNGILVEAIGKEKNRRDDIKITRLSESDWLDEDYEAFVVLRPVYSPSQLENIKNNLLLIADDVEYLFGFPETGKKRTTCADIIFRRLIEEEIIAAGKSPELVTPDYLFKTVLDIPGAFVIFPHWFIR